MSDLVKTRVQVALVIFLFLGSLFALSFNVFEALGSSGREPRVRAQLREAGDRMAEGAAIAAHSLAGVRGRVGSGVDEELRRIATEALAGRPGIEGGFYLSPHDEFAAHSFPTGGHGDGPPPVGTDPPPLEAPYIRLQARQSLDLPPGEVLTTAREVGPSRVVILTEPVGTDRPAILVAWVMTRLTGPADLKGRGTRYATAAALALGGIVLALLLSWNLGRTLKRQRADQGRLRDELRRSEHLAALGRLLAGVAHEVRNPLAGIRSTVQLWQRIPDRSLTPESMTAVIGAVDQLDRLIARLLHFSRADGNERRPVDLGRAVAESLDLMQAEADSRGVVLERDVTTDLPAVSGAADALRQVVLNLLANAMQAMPAGGRLRCSTRRRGGSAELRVADTGHGIAESDRPHLFEPFFTTRPDGTGLGLALCREILVGHGGRIELESTGPGGSVFLVVLPAGT